MKLGSGSFPNLGDVRLLNSGFLYKLTSEGKGLPHPTPPSAIHSLPFSVRSA